MLSSIDPNSYETFILLPEDWDIVDQDFVLDFITDSRSPVDVLVRPWMSNEEWEDLLYTFGKPYSLA